MLVSVIMPTFNQAAFIQQAVESVLGQSYSDLELIIIDNFSSDNTMVVIDRLRDARIKVLRYDNQGVIASARNYGVKHSNGQIIAFLDSDDVWHVNFLAEQISALKYGPVVVSARHKAIGDESFFFDHLAHIDNTEFHYVSASELALANPIVTSSVVINKKNFEEVGGFSEDFEFRYIEDWELWSRCMCLGEIAVNPKRLVDYRVAEKKNRDLVDVKMRHLNVLRRMHSREQINLDVFKQASARVFFEVGKELIAAGKASSAPRFLFKALLYRAANIRFKIALLLLISLLPREAARYALHEMLRRRAGIRF